jgi:hypothetical protein
VVARIRHGLGYRPTANGIYDPMASTHDLPAAINRFRQACAMTRNSAIWYAPEPLTALELDGPLFIHHQEFASLAELATRRFHGRVAVCALLPPRAEASGEGPIIRASFVDVPHWERVQIDGAQYDLWLGTQR